MTTLRLLHLEDSSLDAELIQAALVEGGIESVYRRVQTEDEFRDALENFCPEIILADFSLPSFDGFSALDMARQACRQSPFLFVSGAIGEERAIESLKRGATDYVLKQRLDRLVPAVQRALRETQDRAERKRLEQELRHRAEELAEAHRRKDEFLAMLSHELRNPLGPVRNALHLMCLRPISDPIVLQARDIIGRQVHVLTQLVDDLLDVSRITRGKITLRKEQLDIRTVLEQVAQNVRPLVEARRHELSVELPGEPILVEGDAVRLEQVFVNLLTNAVKYTDPGGHIWLSAAREKERAVIRVRDTGIGMTPEFRTKIFEMFVQAEQALDRAQGGLGIGLTLVRRLVHMHGGEIDVLSEGPGKGSEFFLRFPLRQSTTESDLATDCAAAPTAPSSRRILVVDDNRDGAESLAMVLRILGNEVRLAHDGPAALERAREWKPDLVLLDIGLPGMNGYEVARQLRSDKERGRVLLVAVTGYAREDDRRQASEAGFDHYLVKPIDPDNLQAVLTELSARSDSAAAAAAAAGAERAADPV